MSSSEIAKLEHRWRENRQGLSFAPLAEAYRKMGEPARALEVLAEGLAVNPNYIPASIVLGRTHLDLGDDGQAEAAFERVLDLDSENVIALRALADIAERAHRLVDARERLESLLQVDRGNEEARVQLQQILERIENGEPASEAPAGATPERVEPQAEDLESAPAGVASEPIAADGDSAATAWPGHDASTGPEPVDEDAEPDAMAADGFEWEPEPELPSPDEVEPDPSIELQQNLVPDAEVAPLDDLVVDDAPAISDASASAEQMDGLVGQDFEEHSAGVVPLDDLNSGSGGLPDFGSIERPSELELHPADTNEFQSASAAEELAAHADAEDAGAMGDATPTEWESEEVPFEGLAPESISDADAGESPPVETVAATFGAESLGEMELDAPEPDDVSEDWPDDEAPGEAPEAAPLAAEADEGAVSVEDDSEDDFDWEDDLPPESGPTELVVTESMAELYLRQGHRKEALAVYRLLYQRSPDDFRLRERVDELETDVAAELTSPSSPAAPPVSLAAADEERTVSSLFRRLLQGAPGEPSGAWESAVAPAPRPLEAAASATAEQEAAPTRPAGDHLSLSDVFGDEGSPVPPAVPSGTASDGDDGMSFDAFFGEGDASRARSGAPARDDDDLDQFQAWLQNLKR